MTLVDGPETPSSESTEDQTGNDGNGDHANTDVPNDPDESPERESDNQDQGGLQEDHIGTADEDLGLGLNEEGPEGVTFEGDLLPDLNEADDTPTRRTMETDQGEHHLQRLAYDMDEKLEKIMQSVQRIPNRGEGDLTLSPEDVWSASSQRQLRFDEPKPKVVFFEPGMIS